MSSKQYHHIYIKTSYGSNVIKIVLWYHICLKHIHKHFKSVYIITLKPYLFEQLLNGSKQITSRNKMMKIFKTITSKLNANLMIEAFNIVGTLYDCISQDENLKPCILVMKSK